MTPNPEDLLGTEGVAIETFRRVRDALMESHPEVTIGVTKSQVAFRRRRGFAFLWRPGQYLRRPAAPVVLSIAADVRLESRCTPGKACGKHRSPHARAFAVG